METDRTNLKEGSVQSFSGQRGRHRQESVEELEYWINGVLRQAQGEKLVCLQTNNPIRRIPSGVRSVCR